ncbi:DUF3857 domain-containing protein [bacterium]|nr:DUF3857 domain-containing protein [FCB group bacterium]MBL7190828.1 DUF3857 domain-containing protein [bacterium]
MKKISTILISLIIAAYTAAGVLDIDRNALIKNRPDKNKLPGEESVVIYQGIHYILESDGRINREIYTIRTMFTESALDHYGDIPIHFNERYQTLEVDTAIGYLIDGTGAGTYPNGINQLTPGPLGRAPDYTDFQETMVTICGLEWHETNPLGSVSVLRYKISDKEAWRPWLQGVEYFQWNEPVMKKEMFITVPKGTELKFRAMHGLEYVGHEVTGDDGKTIYHFRLQNVPSLLHDDAFAYRYRFAPTLIFSTCDDWTTISKHFASGIEKAAVATDYLKKAASDAVEDKQTTRQKIEALSKLVRDRVRTINYHDADFIWYHRTADQVLKSAFGNTFDQAILLKTLLASQGIASKIAVSAENYYPEFKVPFTTEFDQFWIVTDNHFETLYIDPSASLAKHTIKDFPGHALFVFDGKCDKPKVVETPKHHNAVYFQLQVKVADDGSYTGSGMFTAGGFFSPYYKANEYSGGAEGWIKSEAGDVLPNIEITSTAVKQLEPEMGEFTFEFKGEKLGDPENGYLILKEPESPIKMITLFPAGVHFERQEHKSPIYLKTIGNREADIIFTLPDKWSVETAPKDFQKVSSLFSGEIKIKIDGNKLYIYESLAFKEKVIESDKYPIIYNFYNTWKSRSNNTIVFKIKN